MLSNKQKMLAGLAHKPNDPELAQLRIENKKRLFQYNTQICPSETEKRAVLIQQILGKCKNEPILTRRFFAITAVLLKWAKTFLPTITAQCWITVASPSGIMLCSRRM
ncbi:hypothetical protein C3007_09655 [Avibacterium gallinarum]|uniref:Galactoside O-acetyltransferase n=1 Tax=Avibacterium gallinarum TaxID=755 RepID=A0A379AZN1_AVIGA|nr:hypothetical protein C3007_09655 [Avibacterium gallinarum]TDP28268.1 maltose acetyltransferase-like protein [Avibacterium gallinarum]SUB27240.1 galactoside O-acetyltransferase [Avibacterium gallinarum]